MNITNRLFIISFLLLGFFSCENGFERSSASQPYEYITSKPTGKKVKYSPDIIMNQQWKNPKADDDLQIYTILPINVTTNNPNSFENISSLTKKNANVMVNGTGSIMFDFGQINAAWLEFDSNDCSGEIEMSISEFNEPSVFNVGAQNRFKTKVPVKYGNTYRLELNNELFEGVRYGWIHVKSFEKEWHIKKVRLVCQVKPVNYNGTFSCSDTLLTKIWYTGAYGVKLNLLKNYFGAILMERSDRYSWTGDAYLSQKAALIAFANYDFICQNIEHTSTQNNGIESYSLYWIQSLIDYYNYSGDAKTVRRYIDNACAKLDHAYEIFGTNPELNFYGWDERLGAGFENHSCPENQNAYKMLSINAWNGFSLMMKTLGEMQLSKKYKDYATDKLIKELRKDSNKVAEFGIHAASDAINTGLLNTQEKQKLSQKFIDRQNRLSYSPFNQYFIIQALANLNEYDFALETVRDQWGGQIKYGGTTFFEVFRPSWNNTPGYNNSPPNNQCGYTSLCHPWSSGIVMWLTEEVLGVKPTSPGFETVTIKPHLGRTLVWVKGDVSTPKGIIHAEFNVAKGFAKIRIPKGVTATVAIPKLEKQIASVKLNSKLIEFSNNVRDNSEYLLFENLGHGNYNYEVEYKGNTPKFVESKWVYDATFVKYDNGTQGNWGAQYGKSGYLLFNYHNEGDKIVHLQQLNSNIKSVITKENGNKQWKKLLNEERILAPDSKNSFPRNVGAIITKDPIACKQTMIVDIELVQPEEYEFSLYFLDFDKQNRRTAIEIIDLETKNIVAPVKIVKNYESGVYITYKYDKSVRFRINQVRGTNAALSGIFFDKP